MIVSFESGCDWADASYHIQQTDLTEAEMDAKRDEYQKICGEIRRAHRADLADLGRAMAELGSFSKWLERQGLVRAVDHAAYSDESW